MKRFGFLVIVTAIMICATTLTGQTLPEPRKGDTVGWHEVRAGETLSGITERHLGDSSLWPENHRLNPGIADPNRLTPGQRIRVILAREIAARRAEVEQVSRRVEKKPRADDWTNARVGDELVERDGLRTYPKSSAALGFDDGSNLVLTENSIVFLREYTSSLRRVDRSQIEVVDGGIDVAVTPKAADKRGKEIEIVVGEVKATPKASKGELGQTRAVKDETSNAAKLMVFAGASAVASAGVTVQVAKGMGTSVRQGEAPAPPERLLAAPKLVAPASGSQASDSLEASWSPVPKAAGYTFEVCRDEDCHQLVDRQVMLTSTSATSSTLPGGELYWRVTARSRSGLDGFPAKTFKVMVVRRVAGRVLVDRAGSLDATTWTGAEAAAVRLYSDDGNGMPDAADTLVSEVQTDDSGRFAFDNAKNGVHWVVIDSRSVSPGETWFEEVSGPAGALCADGNGGTRLLDTSGACFGGRRGDVSDDGSSLETAEHVVKVEVADEKEIGSLDIVFSPSVVTTTADSDDAPQGSLRRFVTNAAALSGEDTMRFVPMSPLESGAKFWTITLSGALPPADEGVTIDGRAWTTSGDVRDTNEGKVSDEKTVGAEGATLAVADRPELEIFANGSSRPLFARAGTLRLRNLALYGSEDVDLTSVGTLQVENCVVGARADLEAPATPPTAGIEVSDTGTAELSIVYVRAGGSFGLLVRSETSEAKVTAKDVEMVDCATGAGVRVESNGSTFERFHVAPCNDEVARVAFELKGQKGTDNQTCRSNRIVSSTVAGHKTGVKIRVGAMDNRIERNDFVGVENGVELELVMGFWVPKGNLIRENLWQASDETIALAGLPRVTGLRFFEGAVSCADGGWAVDRGLDFPGTVSAAREGGAVKVTATVCPEAVIEVYGAIDGDVRYLGSMRSDSSGLAEARIDVPSGLTTIGVIGTDKANTTSRMSFLEID